MSEIETYAHRLTEIGYAAEDANRLVELYRKNGDLDGLESFIASKESIEGVS